MSTKSETVTSLTEKPSKKIRKASPKKPCHVCTGWHMHGAMVKHGLCNSCGFYWKHSKRDLRKIANMWSDFRERWDAQK